MEAAALTRARMAQHQAPPAAKIPKKMLQASTQKPLQRPSTPSMRLMALMMPTTVTSVSGKAII